MLRSSPPRAFVTKFDGRLCEAHAAPAGPSALERLEQHERTWRGQPEWVIRREQECRLLAAAVRRRQRRRSVA